MALEPAAAFWFLLPALPIALWAGWSDLRVMRIPNAAVLALAAVYLVVGPLVLPLETWAWRWTHLAVLLALGFVVSTLGLVGAGDAKLAAAMAPFVALRDLAVVLPLFALVLLASFVLHRGLGRLPAFRRMTADWESWSRNDFPMGIALSGSFLLYLGLAATGVRL